MKRLFTPILSLALAACAASTHAQDYAAASMEDGVIQDPAEKQPTLLYEAGSIGKFTCTLAALRLSERGLFDLDDPLATLVPEMATTPAANVTLRQLLASRSGLADGLLPAFRKSPADVMSTTDPVDALRKFASGELAAEPGSAFSYDLVNWIAVQAVIEGSTGRGIAEVLNDEVLGPAKMTNSRIFVGQIGEGAAPPAGEVRPLPPFLTCAGGLATTPADLLALARFAHTGGLGEKAIAALTTVTTPEEDYTLGGRYILADTPPERAISWQTGSNGAYKSLVVYDPHTDSGFAAMTASNDSSAIQEARDRWMAERKP